MSKNKIYKLGLSVLLATTLTGCVEDSYDTSYSDSTSFSSSSEVYDIDDDSVYDGEIEDESDYVSADISEKYLIRTVSYELETQEFSKDLQGLSSLASEYKGYCVNQNIYNDKVGSDAYAVSSGYLEYRIPSDKLDAYMTALESAYKVSNKSLTTENVGDEYLTLTSNIDAKKTELKRLEELMEKTDNVEDIIKIEERISKLTASINGYEKQVADYDKDINYSVVHIDLEDVEYYTEDGGVWSVKAALKDTWSSFITFCKYLLVMLIYALPYALIGALIYLLYYLNKKLRKIRKKI